MRGGGITDCICIINPKIAYKELINTIIIKNKKLHKKCFILRICRENSNADIGEIGLNNKVLICIGVGKTKRL